MKVLLQWLFEMLGSLLSALLEVFAEAMVRYRWAA